MTTAETGGGVPRCRSFRIRHDGVFRDAEHLGLQHEAVELRLGQRVRALELDGVLRREHEERLRQRPGLAQHGHAVLLHRLEQRRLGLRRRAVDLVGEHDVREHRARVEDERAPPLPLLQDRSARDVAGKQVGRELNALERESHERRERLHELGLAEAREPFDQQVPAGGERHQRAVQEPGLADDDRFESRADAAEDRAAPGHLVGTEQSLSGSGPAVVVHRGRPWGSSEKNLRTVSRCRGASRLRGDASPVPSLPAAPAPPSTVGRAVGSPSPTLFNVHSRPTTAPFGSFSERNFSEPAWVSLR